LNIYRGRDAVEKVERHLAQCEDEIKLAFVKGAGSELVTDSKLGAAEQVRLFEGDEPKEMWECVFSPGRI